MTGKSMDSMSSVATVAAMGSSAPIASQVVEQHRQNLSRTKEHRRAVGGRRGGRRGRDM